MSIFNDSISHCSGDGPRVGIVIPVYNRRNDLAALLNSLSVLNYCNFDVLVVDNGSSDDVKGLQTEFDFEILQFSENHGAIRGFNEGARSFVRRGGYKYIWLLDSDVTVHEGALGFSVRLMEADETIGICVSIIYNSFDRDKVVEAGGKIDLKNGAVMARFGNEPRSLLPEIEDVDYASCGMSLLRVSMIESIGLYDERYHFLWEDMDYGIYVRKNGWRVVVSSQSELYHPPFTEKRNPNIYAYYGVRNPLLTVARHASSVQLPCFLFCNLCRYIRIAFLMIFSGVKNFAGLSFRGILDFISGRFGKAELAEIKKTIPLHEKVALADYNKVHVVGTASQDEVAAALTSIRKETSAPVFLVVQNYRACLFEASGFDKIVTYDDHNSNPIFEYLSTGIKIFVSGGSIVNTDPKVTSPLLYFRPTVVDWDNVTKKFNRSRLGLFSLWQPVLAVVLGYLLALFFLPMVWCVSLKHKRKPPVIP